MLMTDHKVATLAKVKVRASEAMKPSPLNRLDFAFVAEVSTDYCIFACRTLVEFLAEAAEFNRPDRSKSSGRQLKIVALVKRNDGFELPFNC